MLIENKLIVFVNSREYQLRGKDILFIPSGNIHEVHSETSSGTRVFINFELSSVDSYGDMDWIEKQTRDVRLIVPENGSLYVDIEEQFIKILKECKAEGLTSQLYYVARIIDILVMLYKSTPSQINIESTDN